MFYFCSPPFPDSADLTASTDGAEQRPLGVLSKGSCFAFAHDNISMWFIRGKKEMAPKTFSPVPAALAQQWLGLYLDSGLQLSARLTGSEV